MDHCQERSKLSNEVNGTGSFLYNQGHNKSSNFSPTEEILCQLLQFKTKPLAMLKPFQYGSVLREGAFLV